MAIPDTEPAAPLLREMAAHRLIELGALSAPGRDSATHFQSRQQHGAPGAGVIAVVGH